MSVFILLAASGRLYPLHDAYFLMKEELLWFQVILTAGGFIKRL